MGGFVEDGGVGGGVRVGQRDWSGGMGKRITAACNG